MAEVAASIVLAIHLLCMNVLAAGPLLCAWLDRKSANQDQDYQAAVRFLAVASFLLAIVGALLGLSLGWLLWNDSYRDMLRQFHHRITWGIAEFLFSAVLIGIYTAWVWIRPAAQRGVWIGRSSIAVIASLNLLYHFPPLFSMMAGVATGEFQVRQGVDSATFRHLLVEGEVLALTMHFTLASFAVASMVLVVFGAGLIKSTATSRPGAICGARTALVTTVAQIPVGIWLLMQLPTGVQSQLLGADPLSATLLVSGLMATFWLMHQLAAVAFGDVSAPAVRRATAAMIIVVLLMTGVLRRGKAMGISPLHQTEIPAAVENVYR